MQTDKYKWAGQVTKLSAILLQSFFLLHWHALTVRWSVQKQMANALHTIQYLHAMHLQQY